MKFVGRGHFPPSGEKTLQLGRAGRDPMVRRQRPISQYLNLWRGTKGVSEHIDLATVFQTSKKPPPLDLALILWDLRNLKLEQLLLLLVESAATVHQIN